LEKTDDNAKEAMNIVVQPLPQPSIPKRVQDLLSLIFDQNMMKATLKAMDVDIKKMPLGKISKNQIREGYRVLTEIQDILENTLVNKAKLNDCSNRFYTLIPHDFGLQSPPLIDNIETVKKKMQLMEALVDIEIASSLVKDTREEDPMEEYYKALKAQISPLDRSSELYKLLENYAISTHDSKYFSSFNPKVEDIFEVERDGEKDRYSSWTESENRMLLWHGSRLTNWVGIISQGLRIAPPEAPKTGYRFGKGVYFADVISKSGSYCCTSKQNPHAVMLLAEVALGKIKSLTRDEYMDKPYKGTNSTKALGMTAPDPKQAQKISEEVIVPLGSPISTGISSSCSHNEYIVYDVSQIHIRYLIRLKFNHEY